MKKKKHERISPDLFHERQEKEDKLSLYFMLAVAIVVLIFMIYLFLEL